MNFAHFLFAIFIGRFLRFLILAFLVLKFGPAVVSMAAILAHKHLVAIATAVAAAVAAWVLIWFRRQPRTN
jgi:membrane protein DedA with SNARE-associated domain